MKDVAVETMKHTHVPVELLTAAAPSKVMLACGADLLQSFDALKQNGSDLWAAKDRETIASHGIACLLREGTDIEQVEKEVLLHFLFSRVDLFFSFLLVHRSYSDV